MSNKGKTQFILICAAPPDQVAEGDRTFESHGPWMEAAHQRTGDKALLSYNLSKAPELSNPLDSNSAPTGNTLFILSEIDETNAGVVDHFVKTQSCQWVSSKLWPSCQNLRVRNSSKSLRKPSFWSAWMKSSDRLQKASSSLTKR
jgi:hypothetical protein